MRFLGLNEGMMQYIAEDLIGSGNNREVIELISGKILQLRRHLDRCSLHLIETDLKIDRRMYEKRMIFDYYYYLFWKIGVLIIQKNSVECRIRRTHEGVFFFFF